MCRWQTPALGVGVKCTEFHSHLGSQTKIATLTYFACGRASLRSMSPVERIIVSFLLNMSSQSKNGRDNADSYNGEYVGTHY